MSSSLFTKCGDRRGLANALGLEQFGNVECEVPTSAFTDAGVEPRGKLFAAMLDTKASWDDLVRLHAPDDETHDAILANPLYQNITGKFVQSHDYIAMERLYEIHSSGRYDLIVVDTPPTRNAIDFLEAPDRMAEFFGSRLLRWLTAPARSRVLAPVGNGRADVQVHLVTPTSFNDAQEVADRFKQIEPGVIQIA